MLSATGVRDGTLMGESVAVSVLDAVASVKGIDVMALPPLHEAVDTDALDALFAAGGPFEVRFTYAGETVQVRDGVVVVGGGTSVPPDSDGR